MNDDVSDIRHFYDTNTAREHDRLVRHQLEFDMTMKLFRCYLPKRASILEIGAATGRYTIELLRQGHHLSVVDLSPAMIARSEENIAEAGLTKHVGFHVADARELSGFDEDRFDVVLLMGPLYHLVLEADRTLALSEARRVLRSTGLIFTTHISRFGILGHLMANTPDWIERRGEVRMIMERGCDPADWPKGSFRGYFTDVAEIVPFHERNGFQTIELAATEPGISADDEAYNRLEGRQRELWLELLFEVRNVPTAISASRHLIYVGQKCGG